MYVQVIMRLTHLAILGHPTQEQGFANAVRAVLLHT